MLERLRVNSIFSPDAISSRSLGLTNDLFPPPHSPPCSSLSSPKNEYISGRRLYKLQAKISELTVAVVVNYSTLIEHLSIKMPV